MNRKGQLLGHIIVFVIGLIVIGLVVIFGYLILDRISEDQCEVQKTRFSSDLARYLENNRDWGVSRTERLTPPCDVKSVCFLDRGKVDEVLNMGQNGAQSVSVNGNGDDNVNDIIQYSLRAQIPANVFTVSTDGNAEVLDRFSAVSAPVSIVDDDYLCIDVSAGQLAIKMEGTGQLVRIKEP